MTDTDKTLTRYLLGELSTDEQAALEKSYFSDAQVFNQLLKSENELVDRYVRRQLSDVDRQNFERSYLTHPQRRERVKFAEALINRIDNMDLAAGKPSDAVTSFSPWQKLLRGFDGRTPVLSFALALGCLLLVVGAVWLFITNSRSRNQLAQSQVDRRAREIQQQTAANNQGSKSAEQPSPEVAAGVPSPPDSSKKIPTPSSRTTQPFVSLALTVGGVRSSDTGKPSTLMIPPGTTEAHFQLNLKNNEYSKYSVSLQAVGGGEIFSRQNVRPNASRSAVSFTFVVPANKFSSGDYILTLRGVSQDGEIEDLSKSLFRVEKR